MIAGNEVGGKCQSKHSEEQDFRLKARLFLLTCYIQHEYIVRRLAKLRDNLHMANDLLIVVRVSLYLDLSRHQVTNDNERYVRERWPG